MALFGGVAWGKAPAPEASLSGLNSMDPEKKRKFDGKRNPHERERVIQIGQQQLERVIKFAVEKAVHHCVKSSPRSRNYYIRKSRTGRSRKIRREKTRKQK